MTLSDWVKNGWLVPHQPSAKEVSDLVAIVERDLVDSETKALSADWKLKKCASLPGRSAMTSASGFGKFIQNCRNSRFRTGHA